MIKTITPEKQKGLLFLIIIIALAALAVTAALVQPGVSDEAGRIALANAFQCLVIAIAVLLGGRVVLGWLKELNYKKRDYILLGIFTAVLCIAVMAFFYFYFKDEQDIKVYDYSEYWRRVLQNRTDIAGSIPDYLTGLRDSLQQEYTALPAFPLLPASYFLGTSYTAYCQSIFLVYSIPASFLLTVFAMRILSLFRKSTQSVLTFIVCFALCAVCPLMLWPVMHGYLDMVGVLIIALMLNYTLRWDGIQFSAKRNIILALLSLLLVLSRRWYAYYVVGFYAVLVVVGIIKAIAGRKHAIRNIGLIIANIAMIAAIGVVCAWVVNPGIFGVFLGANYGEAYSAYKTISTGQDILYLVYELGFLMAAAAVAGIVLSLKDKESRGAGIRLLIAALVAGAMFLQVQSFGYHHKYLITPTLLVFALIAAGYLMQLLEKNGKIQLGVAVLLFAALNLSFAYTPPMEKPAHFSRIAATSIRSYPVVNPYYDTYKQIVADLTEKTDGKIASVYMVGEDEFTPEYLRRLALPEQEDAAPWVMENSIVDLRDGFPSQLFMADYVIVSDTFATSFSETQQVSYQVYDMFINDPLVMEYYEVEEVYTAGDANLILFRKTKPADVALVDQLKQRLQQHYPDTPFVYEPNYFLALAEFEQTMRYYNFWGDELLFYKSGEEAARFHLNDTATFKTLSFDLENTTAGLVLIIENENGEIYRSDIAEGRQAYSVDITGSEYLDVRMESVSGSPADAAIRLFFQQSSLQ